MQAGAVEAHVHEGVGYVPLRARDGSIRAWAKVDPGDMPRIGSLRWYLNSRGYAGRQVRAHPVRLGQFSLSMQRDVYGLTRGDAPGMHVDHINGDKLDNRRENLRLIAAAENAQNKRSTRGVTQDPRTGKWVARAQVNGKRYLIGGFDTQEEATAARAAWDAAHMPYAA